MSPERRRADGGHRGPWRHDHGWIEGHPAGVPTGAALHRAGPGGPQPRVMRRLGCFFGLLFVLIVVGAISVLGLIASWLGIFQPGPGTGTSGQGLILVLVLLVAIGLLRLARGFRSVAGPIDELVAAARRIEGGDLTVRVTRTGRGPRELRSLATAFNTMADRLEVDEQQRRTLLADVSHELRTPLAVVRGNLEAIQDGVHPADPAHLQAIIDETEVLARLIEDLRTVALAEAGTLPLYRDATDLGLVATDAAAAHQASAEAGGIELSVETVAVPPLDLDPVRIREVVGNLLANAIRHTAPGGRIRLTVHPEADGGARLVVSDTGSGIEPDVLPHIFDRFWKAPGSRGSGLGLAIVRNLVERHGGTVSASSEPGVGTEIAVRLPGPSDPADTADPADRGTVDPSP